MVLKKQLFTTCIILAGCDLPLLGGRGVLYFSKLAHHFNLKTINHA